MAKLQHTFVQGKMNKDLDERLIPNGQYRDAQNIQVSTSEGSDVGAVENILGNVLKSFEGSGDWASDFGLTNPVCIGVAKDSQNEKIYWLLTSNSVDAIMEYDQNTGIVAPVLVDTGNVLNFNVSNLITGINILEGMLMWTDDLNEPRIINIATFKAGSAQGGNTLSVTTQVYGRSFVASDINVIKLKPSISLSYAAVPSERSGSTNGTGITPVTIAATFTSGNPNLPLAIGSDTTVVTNVTANWLVDDIVVFRTNYTNTEGYKIYFEARGKITVIAGTSVTINILNLSQTLTGNNYIWEGLLEEGDTMFTTSMPRFAYRWKYNDNKYSAFSPWTETVFVPNVYDYDPQNAYNTAMNNNIRKLTISGFEIAPADVEKIDILYKDSNSTLVYKVDEVPVSTAAYSITSELIYNAINSNQLIRAYDNVPRKAKSQELIGNRIVYGNYLQNYNVATTPALAVSTTATDVAELLYPEASVKSLRSYQIGIVYLDENGRETPVFTNSTATINIPKTASDKSNVIKVLAEHVSPGSWATHFKYYIKDISNEYYNLILDRYYDSDDGNIWLSFPSAERNKVQIDDFIILKKENNSSESVNEEAKYKIIDISNEVPTSVKSFRKEFSASAVTKGATATDFIPINSGLSKFNFDGPTEVQDPEFYSSWHQPKTTFIRFLTSTNTSAFYELESGGFDGQSTTSYAVNLTTAISDQDNFLDLLAANANYSMQVHTVEELSSPVFEGKFYVKINRDAAFEDAVLYNFTGGQGDYNVASTVPVYANMNTPPGGSIIGELTGWGWQESVGVTPSPFLDQPVFNSTYVGLGYAPYPSGGFSSGGPSAIMEANLTPGGVIQFNTVGEGWGNIYEIASVIVTDETPRQGPANTQTLRQFRITLTTPYIDQGTGLVEDVRVLTKKRSRNIQFDQFTKVLGSPNAAIFETEPSEAIDLELYYEASNSIPIANLGVEQTLPYFNCFTFGNGVESNRVRDDYNAKTIGKGVKVSSILEDGYNEERRGAGLIYSGIFNSTSGVNELNQFIAGLKITKDLNPSYGTLQKLHARDTDLIALCEDKCFKILANKDALYNADGNSNVTSNNNVLGQTIPFVGEYGISKNPESFASFGFRSYFVDKARGTVLRLSRDGITDLGAKQMSYFFQDKLKTNGTAAIIGAYDADIGSYNVLLDSESISFKEQVDGWNTRMSYSPEFGISLNNEYYTFKNGELYEHSNPLRSNFYGTQYSSTVTPIFNDAPTSIKNFKTLSYEGDAGWTASIATNEQSGTVSTWKKREGLYFNYIMGDATTLANIDTSEFSVQGIGNVLSFDGGDDTITINGEINVSLQAGDDIYSTNGVVAPAELRIIGTVASVDRVSNEINLTNTPPNPAPVAGNFMLFAKNSQVNTSGLLGYYGEVVLATNSSDKKELFAVNSEIFISSE